MPTGYPFQGYTPTKNQNDSLCNDDPPKHPRPFGMLDDESPKGRARNSTKQKGDMKDGICLATLVQKEHVIDRSHANDRWN